MRKIENAVALAVKCKNTGSLGGNTVLTVDNNTLTLALHGSKILKTDGKKVIINMNGYNTSTTRSRLNAALMGLNSLFEVRCKNGVARLLKNNEFVSDIPSSGDFVFDVK